MKIKKYLALLISILLLSVFQLFKSTYAEPSKFLLHFSFGNQITQTSTLVYPDGSGVTNNFLHGQGTETIPFNLSKSEIDEITQALTKLAASSLFSTQGEVTTLGSASGFLQAFYNGQVIQLRRIERAAFAKPDTPAKDKVLYRSDLTALRQIENILRPKTTKWFYPVKEIDEVSRGSGVVAATDQPAPEFKFIHIFGIDGLFGKAAWLAQEMEMLKQSDQNILSLRITARNGYGKTIGAIIEHTPLFPMNQAVMSAAARTSVVIDGLFGGNSCEKILATVSLLKGSGQKIIRVGPVGRNGYGKIINAPITHISTTQYEELIRK